MEASTDTTAAGSAPAASGTPDPRLMDTTVIRRTEVLSLDGAPPPPAPPAPPDPDATPDVGAAAPDAPGPNDSSEVADEPTAGVARLIRPYAMTGGRTTANTEISLESQIQTSTRLDTSNKKYRWEAAKILTLAERPMALVELAARAEIPIGVARVVISDLVEEGAVNVQRNVTVTSYSSLLEKVLDGIRDL